jgi:hypothetical protein
MRATKGVVIEGQVKPGFEPVRDAFAENLARRHELGGACCALAAPAVPPTRGFHDECLNGEVQFALGFMKSCPTWPFGGERSFGSPGAGGALGFADPDAGIGYGYVTSQMGTTLTGDPRDVALRDALYACIGRWSHVTTLVPRRRGPRRRTSGRISTS